MPWTGKAWPNAAAASSQSIIDLTETGPSLSKKPKLLGTRARRSDLPSVGDRQVKYGAFPSLHAQRLASPLPSRSTQEPLGVGLHHGSSPGAICEHNRERTSCKSCGGSAICEHNRRRSSCKSCGDSSICEHNCIRRVQELWSRYFMRLPLLSSSFMPLPLWSLCLSNCSIFP